MRICYEMAAALYGLHFLNRSHSKFSAENILTHSEFGKDHIKVIGVEFEHLNEDLRKQDYIDLCYNISCLFSEPAVGINSKLNQISKILNGGGVNENQFSDIPNANYESGLPYALRKALEELLTQQKYNICYLSPLIYLLASRCEYLDSLILFPYCPQSKYGKESILLSELGTLNEVGNGLMISNYSISNNELSGIEVISTNQRELTPNSVYFGTKSDLTFQLDIDSLLNTKLKKIELMTTQEYDNKIAKLLCVRLTAEFDSELLIGSLPKTEFVLHCISGSL